MKISTLGTHEHNAWFAGRLAGRGFAVHTGDTGYTALLDRIDQPGWSGGLIVEDILIDLGTSSVLHRHELAARCQAMGLGYAELAGPWISIGERYGFPLFIGGTPEVNLRLHPLFDALAPQAGAWLHCGPAGGGYYAAKVFDALGMAWVLAMPDGWPEPGAPLKAPDWTAFFSKQQELANRLLAFSQLYLSFHPEAIELDPRQQLASFNHPPQQQAHFSANLARLIVLALGQKLALQEIFEGLMVRAGGTVCPATQNNAG